MYTSHVSNNYNWPTEYSLTLLKIQEVIDLDDEGIKLI